MDKISNAYNVKDNIISESLLRQHLKPVSNFDYDKHAQGFEMKIITRNKDFLEIAMRGVPSPIVAAIKKTAFASVPTMAIDRIDMKTNTTGECNEQIVEVVSHIPFKVDPKQFLERVTEAEEPNSTNAVKFKFAAKCRNLNNSLVYADKFQWVPIDDQKFPANKVPRPIYPELLVAMLEPGQELIFDAYLFKGNGSKDSKFSPSGPVILSLIPDIRLKKRCIGEEAAMLKNLFSPGVIEINDDGEAVVARPELCRSREVANLKRSNLFDVVLLMQNYRLSIEATGVMSTDEILKETLDILMKDGKELITDFNNL